MFNRQLRARLSMWWNGEWYKNSPEDKVVYIGKIYKPSSIRAHKTLEYLKREHKFLIGSIIALLGILSAYIFQ